MAKKPKFDARIHDDNPEWSDEDFARARPAAEVLPPDVLAQFKNKGGRPRSEETKESIKLRLDRIIITTFKKSGPGWQTRMNDTLKRAAKRMEKDQGAQPHKRRA